MVIVDIYTDMFQPLSFFCVCCPSHRWCVFMCVFQWYHVRDFRKAAGVGDRKIYENVNAKNFVRGGDGVFVRVPSEGDGTQNPLQGICDDTNDECASWAESGECENNPGYMRMSCKRSCGLCPPT